MRNSFEEEIRTGKRYEFGKNWQNFLNTLTKERVDIAICSIREMLDVDDLTNKTVLDIGSGSGLFSLAARKLGAKVYSFDYDPKSVACAIKLRSIYFPDDEDWNIKRGSILDKDFLSNLNKYDVVYSWGVLHHTGDMWSAIDNASKLVDQDGKLFIALYNDMGWRSGLWKQIKKIYCSNKFGKALVSLYFIPFFILRELFQCILQKKNIFSTYKEKRGMSIFYDWFDWLGGLPFEVASVENTFYFLKERGFQLDKIKTTNGHANNQFVFIKK